MTVGAPAPYFTGKQKGKNKKKKEPYAGLGDNLPL
jgi:hypothetical protein